jgi:hypothetical protein
MVRRLGIQSVCSAKILSTESAKTETVAANVSIARGRMYGPPSDCKEKAEGEKTSLRKSIRPLVELSAPGQNELRAYLSLLAGRCC